MREYFKPQIDTVADRANFVLYGAASTALCVTVEHFMLIPQLMAAAFVASSAFSYLALSGHSGIMKRNFPPTPEADLPFGSEDLPDITAQLSEKFNIYPAPTLHVIKERVFIEDDEGFRIGTLDSENASQEDDRTKAEIKLVEAYKKYANGLTYGNKKTGIIVSGKLMNLLSAEDKDVLIAHELGHQAARHLQKSVIPNIIATTATFAASMNFALTVFSSWTGWLAPTLAFVAAAKSGPLVRWLVPESLSEQHPQLPSNLRLALGAGTLMGVAYFSHNTQIIGAWVLGQSANVTVKLLNAAYSRGHEYQADRLAAEAIGDPKGAAESLIKISSYDEELFDEPVEAESSQGGVISRIFKAAKEAFRSHPQIEKRVGRLERMAKKFDKAQAVPG